MKYAILYHTQDGPHQLTIEADTVACDGVAVLFVADKRQVAGFLMDGIIGWHEMEPDLSVN